MSEWVLLLLSLSESIWQSVQEVHHLHRRRGAVWTSCYPASSAAGHQKTACLAAEAVRPLQQRHRNSQWLLRHSLGRHQHWKSQQWAARHSDQVRNMFLSFCHKILLKQPSMKCFSPFSVKFVDYKQNKKFFFLFKQRTLGIQAAML